MSKTPVSPHSWKVLMAEEKVGGEGDGAVAGKFTNKFWSSKTRGETPDKRKRPSFLAHNLPPRVHCQDCCMLKCNVDRDTPLIHVPVTQTERPLSGTSHSGSQPLTSKRHSTWSTVADGRLYGSKAVRGTIHTVPDKSLRRTTSNRIHRRQKQTCPLRPVNRAGRPTQHALVQLTPTKTS